MRSLDTEDRTDPAHPPHHRVPEHLRPAVFASRFTPDQSRSAEFLACLWQGPGARVARAVEVALPAGRAASDAAPLGGRRRRLCATSSAPSVASGRSTPRPSPTPPPGSRPRSRRDLDAFGRHLETTGSSPDAIATALDVRRRGMEASSQDDAAAAGRGWAAEQEEALNAAVLRRARPPTTSARARR